MKNYTTILNNKYFFLMILLLIIVNLTDLHAQIEWPNPQTVELTINDPYGRPDYSIDKDGRTVLKYHYDQFGRLDEYTRFVYFNNCAEYGCQIEITVVIYDINTEKKQSFNINGNTQYKLIIKGQAIDVEREDWGLFTYSNMGNGPTARPSKQLYRTISSIEIEDLGVGIEQPINYGAKYKTQLAITTNNELCVNYYLHSNTFVELLAYNTSGRLISVLLNDYQNIGLHRFNLKSDLFGKGVVCLVLKTNGYNTVKKAIIIR